jgi:phosphoglycolate phosphatase
VIEVDALLFDLDGTLIDSKLDLTLSVQWLQKKLGVPESTEEEVGSFVGDGVVKLVQRAIPSLEGSALAEAVEEFKVRYRHHCLDNTRAYPGTREMLEHFRDKKLAVVTNKPIRASRRILDGLGLSRHFQVVVGGDSLEQKKPDPQPLLYALKEMDVLDLRRVIMIGDGPADVIAGKRAGVWTCGIRSNIGRQIEMLQAKPDISLERLTEVSQHVR